MKPNSSCQSTGVPTRHGSVSKCAPCVESVIRTNGETSRFTPSTEDIAAQTSERLARTGNSTISRIRPDCPDGAFLRKHRPHTTCVAYPGQPLLRIAGTEAFANGVDRRD